MSFTEGDRVRHTGDDAEGEVVDTEFEAPHFQVEWDDGYKTLENLHTVEKIDG